MAYREQMGQHPLIRHFATAGDTRPCKISDLLSAREFRRLPLYREYYRLAPVHDQLALVLPARSGEVVAFTLCRAQGQFTERHRQLLACLTPHLARLQHATVDLASGRAGSRISGPAPAQAGPGCLTPRERDVLELLTRGHTDVAIGRELGISPRTVEKYVQSAYVKLGVRNRAAAVAAFLRLSSPVS